MKVKLAGSNHAGDGFSTLEMIIALALMALIITTSLQTMYMSQYWILSSEVSGEALQLAKTSLQEMTGVSAKDFYAASSTPLYLVRPLLSSTTLACGSSFCYESNLKVRDISACAKDVQSEVSWRISARYSKSSVVLDSLLISPSLVQARGGDCLLSSPIGNWASSSVLQIGVHIQSSQLSSGIDALGEYLYVTASSAPQLRMYRQPSTVGGNPVLVGTSSGADRRLNDVDVVRDLVTGRSYAYVTQHGTSSQLGVFDVTDVSKPVWLTQRTMLGVDSNGSFPQGWRVVVYGGRLYILTRETAGAEFHIFDIRRPEQPVELTSGMYNLNRTVNDFEVREQLIAGIKRRFIIMSASADLKELGIFEVTDDVPIERIAINLPGTEDALSLALAGNTLYLGRRAVSGGPELYEFDIVALLGGVALPMATSEVGADVSSMWSSGDFLYLGTNRSGAEFQVWSNDTNMWDAVVANSGRIASQSVPKLGPLGVELTEDFIYALSQSITGTEQLVVISTP